MNKANEDYDIEKRAMELARSGKYSRSDEVEMALRQEYQRDRIRPVFLSEHFRREVNEACRQSQSKNGES